jgi:hypothetical protein
VADRTQRTRITHLQKETRENREGCLRSTVFSVEGNYLQEKVESKRRAKSTSPLYCDWCR